MKAVLVCSVKIYFFLWDYNAMYDVVYKFNEEQFKLYIVRSETNSFTITN